MQERTVTIYGINHSGIKYKKKASMYEIVRLYVNIKNHKWVRNFQYIIDEDRVIFLIIEKIPILNWFNGHDYYCYDIYGHKIDAKFIRTCTTVSGVKNSIDEDLVKLVILMHDELESVFRLDDYCYIIKHKSGRYLLVNRKYLKEYNIQKMLNRTQQEYRLIDFTENRIKILK